MDSLLGHLAEIVQGMTHKVNLLRDNPLAAPAGRWWVLICGDPLDTESFEARDEARMRLLRRMAASGLEFREYVWVWDEVDLAQALAGDFPSLEQARDYAEHLRSKGLEVRIRKELPHA